MKAIKEVLLVAFLVFGAVLALLYIGNILVAPAAASALQAELVATRTAADSAAVLARDNDGWIVVARQHGLHANEHDNMYSTSATSIRVYFRGATYRPTKEFLIFPDGNVEISEWRIGDHGDEENIGETQKVNWGNFAKMQ
jgi:hypothetical protein